METTIKLPKQLKNDKSEFVSFIVNENGFSVASVSMGLASDPKLHKEVKNEIIRRYNYFPLIYKALVFNTIVLALITILLLVL
jgi:hypothetical protein